MPANVRVASDDSSNSRGSLTNRWRGSGIRHFVIHSDWLQRYAVRLVLLPFANNATQYNVEFLLKPAYNVHKRSESDANTIQYTA